MTTNSKTDIEQRLEQLRKEYQTATLAGDRKLLAARGQALRIALEKQAEKQRRFL